MCKWLTSCVDLVSSSYSPLPVGILWAVSVSLHYLLCLCSRLSSSVSLVLCHFSLWVLTISYFLSVCHSPLWLGSLVYWLTRSYALYFLLCICPLLYFTLFKIFHRYYLFFISRWGTPLKTFCRLLWWLWIFSGLLALGSLCLFLKNIFWTYSSLEVLLPV